MKSALLVTVLGCALSGPQVQAQALVGRPCLFNEYFPEWRCFPAILRDAEGHLTCGRNRLNLGGATQAPRAAGPVIATSTGLLGEGGPRFHFTYRDVGGAIQDLWHVRKGEKDEWFSQKLTLGGATLAPAAAGNPSGFVAEKTYHVVYRDQDGRLQDLAYEGTWQVEALNRGGATDAPGAAGDPVQLELQGQRHVVYRDEEGSLQDLWFNHGWHVRTLNRDGLTQAPAAAGDPAAMEDLRTTHVVYRDRAGQVQYLTFDGAWHGLQLTGWGLTGAPAAAGDPSLLVLGGGRTPHVVYRDEAGGLQDLWFEGTWQARRLNCGGATAAPPAASEPFLMVPPSNCEYVAYVDTFGAGQLLTNFQQQGWVASPLNADTPPRGPLEIKR